MLLKMSSNIVVIGTELLETQTHNLQHHMILHYNVEIKHSSSELKCSNSPAEIEYPSKQNRMVIPMIKYLIENNLIID